VFQARERKRICYVYFARNVLTKYKIVCHRGTTQCAYIITPILIIVFIFVFQNDSSGAFSIYKSYISPYTNVRVIYVLLVTYLVFRVRVCVCVCVCVYVQWSSSGATRADAVCLQLWRNDCIYKIVSWNGILSRSFGTYYNIHVQVNFNIVHQWTATASCVIFHSFRIAPPARSPQPSYTMHTNQ
jgi:hypothetical protein